MKAGIMGGTFDPIHLAHLIIAEEARSALGLDRIIFIPAGDPWMKSERSVTAPQLRAEMVRLAIEGNPAFELSLIEVERTGPSYTVDTLEQVLQELGIEAELFLLLGWDSLADLPSWKAPYRISKMCRLAAFPRPGCPQPDLAMLEKSMPGVGGRIIFLPGPHLDISSTAIRQAVAAGRSVRYRVPEPVLRYITEHNLYL